MADTAWNLFHKLSREEAQLYLNNRAEKGFNVIQAVILGEHDGLNAVNAYNRVPLKNNNPETPDLEGNYSYWEHIDYIIDIAEKLNLYMAILPTWGDKFNLKWGIGPVIFNAENAYTYGKWLGDRYKNNKNIIWVLGGDRPLENDTHFEIIRSMAKGIKDGDKGKHLLTFHPFGEHCSSDFVSGEDWLDLNMYQSGHGKLNFPNYEKIFQEYNSKPVKPVVDAEPRYEDHPIGFNPQNGYYDDFDVRQAAYWAVFSGAFVHTYGHHSIWSMCTSAEDYFIMEWKEALDRPGAGQMMHLKKLIELKNIVEMIPDQSIIAKNYQGANHMRALRGSDYAFVYSPCGLECEINLGIISGDEIEANWYNPRTGEMHRTGSFKNIGKKVFKAPTSGRGCDWVLVLESIK